MKTTAVKFCIARSRVTSRGGHKMLSNFIHIALWPNKGSTKQTMVIAIQWPDHYRPVLSHQAVFTAIKWRLTCSASEQRTPLSAVCADVTIFCWK